MTPPTLLTLPRELRDQILGHLSLLPYVYTSSSTPNTSNLHRSKIDATTYIDTRLFLPCRPAPNVLAVCRQLRHECLEHHSRTLNTQFNTPTLPAVDEEGESIPTSNILAARIGNENDESAERLNDACLRITLEALRPQRGSFGYYTPVREELSPRFLALLPLISHATKLRLAIWPGFDWWSGARPRATKLVNGRIRSAEEITPDKPDAVSFAIGRVLEKLPEVRELEIDVMAHTSAISRWDFANPPWVGIQYWLDGPIAREGTRGLVKVKRNLVTVWERGFVESFYVQEEEKKGKGKWWVKRKGDVRTPAVLALADPGELDDAGEAVDEEFERAE